MDDAKAILWQELERRNLQPPPNHSKPASRPAGMTAPRPLVFAGGLVLNICIALFCTPVLEAGIGKMFHPHSLAGLLWKWWTLDLLCAAGLGFSISRLWRSGNAVWTWVLPVVWFAFRFVPMALSGGNQSVLVGHNVWSQFSGNGCASGMQSLACRNFFLFTLPLIRGIAYSLGAFLSLMFTAYSKSTARNRYRYGRSCPSALISEKSR
jgi:hypothetical protein